VVKQTFGIVTYRKGILLLCGDYYDLKTNVPLFLLKMPVVKSDFPKTEIRRNARHIRPKKQENGHLLYF